jgi:hypothetical protein
MLEKTFLSAGCIHKATCKGNSRVLTSVVGVRLALARALFARRRGAAAPRTSARAGRGSVAGGWVVTGQSGGNLRLSQPGLMVDEIDLVIAAICEHERVSQSRGTPE